MQNNTHTHTHIYIYIYIYIYICASFHSISALLWTAPELLRLSIPPPGGSKAGDVYSYGIILQEIAIRDRAYGMITDIEPKGMMCVRVLACVRVCACVHACMRACVL